MVLHESKVRSALSASSTTLASRSAGRVSLPEAHPIDDTPIDPLPLARLRVKTGCKMPDCCVLASAATRNKTVATFDAQLRRHADGDLS